MKNKIVLFLTCILVHGCYTVNTTTTYDRALTRGSAVSEPIYLSFKDNKKSSFHFYLKHNITSNEYFLHVRWSNHNRAPLFNGQESTLKLLIDNSEIITLKPIKAPKIVAYNLETEGHEEEAVFILTYDQINKLAFAKSVEAQLTGKYIIVTGYFNKIHTFKAFKNFINNG